MESSQADGIPAPLRCRRETWVFIGACTSKHGMAVALYGNG